MTEFDDRDGFSVLVVEDTHVDYLLMMEARGRSRFKAKYTVVSDGPECLDYLFKRGKHAKSPTPDLIILDLTLPKKNGYEVLKEIKGDENLKVIPVVVFTGSNAPKDVERAYQAGANCYVVKPIGLNNLERTLALMEEFWLGLARLPVTES